MRILLKHVKRSFISAFLICLTIPLRRSDKCVALSNLASTINGKIYKGHISAPKWNNKFQLLDGSYSTSDIQDYFEYFLKKHDALLLHTTK